MASTTSKPQLRRSLSWPSAMPQAKEGQSESKHAIMPATPRLQPVSHLFGDDDEDNPEDLFLSPVQPYEYEEWSDDSDDDDDGEEVEWDAGITDFALFDTDRRRAQEQNRPLPGRWNNMLAQQASALHRAQQRSRVGSESEPIMPPLPASSDDLPALTPDASPNLRDDYDDDDALDHHAATEATVPEYLTVVVTPPNDGDKEIDEDDDLPLTFHVPHKQKRMAPNRRLQRPGLSHSRTMSGKVHVWRRPSFNIFTVRENVDAERRAELAMCETWPKK